MGMMAVAILMVAPNWKQPQHPSLGGWTNSGDSPYGILHSSEEERPADMMT